MEQGVLLQKLNLSKLMNNNTPYLKILLMTLGGIFSLAGLFFYFFIMPDEVFEINIDSSIEKIDTSFYPKYRDLSNYSNICCTYTQFSNDTVIVDSIKKVLFNPERNGRGCREGRLWGEPPFKISYNKYKADSVFIHIKYEFYH